MSERLAGRYTLGPLIGAGGMGRVHAAQDTFLDRPVAVKLLGDAVGEADAERLVREARTAARFQHPSAVAVYDVGEHDGQPFVVMELVEGESLADRLRREGPLPPAEVVAVLASVLSALDAAHAAGLVHRDVKPANVLLPVEGGAKLADFGIAKQVWGPSAELTSTGMVLGTPTYLAPEQAAGEQPTAAVDIYGAGVVAYEALSGAPPFSRATPLATALAHQRDPVPPLPADVPAGIAAVVRRALAKDPADRFRSAAEMREALRSASAVPASRAGGVSGRWKALAAVALVAVSAALLVGERGGGGGDPIADPPGADTDADDSPAAEGNPDDEGGAGEQPDEEPEESAPASLEELATMIAADPDDAGPRADDLVDDLLEVGRESDEEDQREDARELIRDIAEWHADAELSAEVAGLAVELLEPVGRPPAGALAPVSATFAALAVRSDQGGEKHKDVLSKMDDLLGKEGEREWRREAEKLLREIEKWQEDGELDSEVAGEAADALNQLLDGRTTALDHPVRRLLEASHHR